MRAAKRKAAGAAFFFAGIGAVSMFMPEQSADGRDEREVERLGGDAFPVGIEADIGQGG